MFLFVLLELPDMIGTVSNMLLLQRNIRIITGTIACRYLKTTNVRYNSINDLKNMLSQAANAKIESTSKPSFKKSEGKIEWKKKNDKERYLKSDKERTPKGDYQKKEKSFKGDKQGKGEKFSKYDKQSKYSFREKKKKESLAFLETGNDRDKEAAKRIMSEALKNNSLGLVQLIRPNVGAEMLRVTKAYEGLSLKESGLMIVGTRNIKNEDEDKHGLKVGEKYLILKVSDRQQVIKQYGDYLNEVVVEKLKLKNSIILDKQKKGKKDDNKNELKVVQIGWNINLNDLTGQKKFEIENHLKKGNDVEIIIDEKDVIDKENSSQYVSSGNESSDDKLILYAKRRKDLNDVEFTMRNKMLKIIDDTLRSIEKLPEANIGETKGFIESRILIKVKGIVRKNEDEKLNKKEQKALEKKQRAEKIEQRRLEKEKQLAEQMQEIQV